MKKFHQMLFYKVFMLASLVRTKSNASFISGFITGFLIVLSIVYLLGAVKLFRQLPSFIYPIAFLASIVLNVYYFVNGKRYEIIISSMESTKTQFTTNIFVYLFLIWCLIGFLFLK